MVDLESLHASVTGHGFNLHESYPALMGGARRKPALPITGPAVTWHLAFWAPRETATRRALWVQEIEKFILALYHHLADSGFSPHTRSHRRQTATLQLLNNVYQFNDRTGNKPSAIPGQAPRYQIFRVRFSYGGVPATITIELHDEYLTVCTSIDLAWKPKDKSLVSYPLLRSIENLTSAIATFNVDATTHYNETRAGTSEANKHATRRAFSKSYEQIYSNIWIDVFDLVFRSPYSLINKTMFGDTFADLRGFVAAAGQATFITEPGSYTPKKTIEERIGTQTFEDSDTVKRVDVLLCWLKADKGFESEDDDRDADLTEPVEFSYTTFLDHRVIYATALGAQLSRSRGAQAPVTFMMLARNQARWQLGRMVERIQTLGTLRLAALYDLPHLINAGFELRLLDQKLDSRVGTPLNQAQMEKDRGLALDLVGTPALTSPALHCN
jgi:hypothetical protein